MCCMVYTFIETFSLKFMPQHIARISCALSLGKTLFLLNFVRLINMHSNWNLFYQNTQCDTLQETYSKLTNVE